MSNVPLSPLDRALRDLESTWRDARAPVQSLREAIAQCRLRGPFDEAPIVHELNNILSHAEFNVDALVRLTAKLLQGAP